MPRTRLLTALVVALLATPSVAAAQTQTETQPLGDYTQTLPTQTQAPTQTEDKEPTQTQAPQTTSGGGGNQGSAPEVTQQPTPSQPASLAFTGFEAAFVGLFGIALMGAAVILQRRRRTE